jgi:hypothetical protein
MHSAWWMRARGARSGLARAPLLFLLVVGVIVFYPAVRTTFLLDDYLHVAMVEGTFPAKRGPFELYDFVADDDRAAMFARGLLPWWAHPAFTIRFFRPLSSAILWLDHKVFSHAPLPMHLHSVVWWIAAALAARALFRRALPARPAAMATVIFALAPCHAIPIAWLANREAIMTLVFGVFALMAHAKWRGEATRGAMLGRAAIAASLFAAAFLCGGEYALGLGGYVLAMELVEARPLGRRAVALVPFAAPAMAYLAVRWRLGYGAFGSGFYTDPVRSPLAFATQLPWRLAALAGEGWLTIDTSRWQSAAARAALGAVAVAGIAATLVLARRAHAHAARDHGTRAWWLPIGSLFALAPSLAVVPSPRLLGVAMIGVAATVALVLDHAWFGDVGARARGPVQTIATLLGFAHFLHAPAASWLVSTRFFDDGARFAAAVRSLRSRVGDTTDADIGVMRGTFGMFFAPFALGPRGQVPRRWTVLAETGHVLALRRDARTIELVAAAGHALYPVGAGSFLRAPEMPLRAGDVIEVPGMRASIVDVGAGGPRDVVFTFDDEPTARRWIQETYFVWPEIALPLVGFGAPYDP